MKNVPVARRTQLNRVNWMNDVEPNTKVMWVVDVGESEEEVWAMDMVCYRYPLFVTFLRPSNRTASEIAANTTIEAAVEARLSEARDAFRAYNSGNFQLAGMYPSRTLTDTEPFNAILAELQNKYIGGGFNVSPLVGD